MSRSAPQPRRRLLPVALAVAALLVLPLFFAFLAPPPLAGGEAPSVSAASRDLSAAALDRIERLLSGELTVRLLGLVAGPAFDAAPPGPVPAVAAASVAHVEPRARPSETERAL